MKHRGNTRAGRGTPGRTGASARSTRGRASQAEADGQRIRPWQAAFLVVVIALTLLVAALVGTHRWHIGVPGQWTWPFYFAHTDLTVEYVRGAPKAERAIAPSVRSDEESGRRTGGIRIFITPMEAVLSGAGWRVDGGDWQPNRKTVGGLSIGPHVVEFREVPGWQSPAPTVVNAPEYAPPLWLAGPAILFLILLAATIALCLRQRLATKRRELMAVVVVMLFSLGLIASHQKAHARIRPYVETIERIASEWMSGYFAESVGIEDMPLYLRRYKERISRLTLNERLGHLSDHPVGPVAFHWVVNRAMESSPGLTRGFSPRRQEHAAAKWLAEQHAGTRMSDGEFAGIWASAFLLSVAFWLTLIPVYFIARRLHSPEAGLIAMALTALIPSLNLFGPYIDQVFPLLATGAFLCWIIAMDKGSMFWAAASAALVVIGMLWSLAFLTLIALIGAAAVLRLWRDWREPEREPRLKPWLILGGGWASGFVIVSLLPTALFGYDVFGVWRLCLSQHGTFNVLFERTWLAWTQS